EDVCPIRDSHTPGVADVSRKRPTLGCRRPSARCQGGGPSDGYGRPIFIRACKRTSPASLDRLEAGDVLREHYKVVGATWRLIDVEVIFRREHIGRHVGAARTTERIIPVSLRSTGRRRRRILLSSPDAAIAGRGIRDVHVSGSRQVPPEI